MLTKRRASRGFTLLELLVVLFLISLMVGVAATRYSAGSESAELKAEARKLVALLRQTRARAVSESISRGVIIPTDVAGYRLVPDSMDVLLPESMHLVIDPLSEDLSFAQPGIFFYPDGSSNGGSLTLATEKGSWQLDVNWLTGEVALAEP